ncbi:hypothetical protein MPH_09907 [Macrophomina phaseolina MS6]|uniref:Uncharacterized protein n=1 Tax=Macrophomina phaseolina (strain MS6) TaxID=1126212 RepID=K2RRZ5_MACPH|nr:hypothetical protein MPH_09907 [Macrophomina phaseolina MS6]
MEFRHVGDRARTAVSRSSILHLISCYIARQSRDLQQIPTAKSHQSMHLLVLNADVSAQSLPPRVFEIVLLFLLPFTEALNALMTAPPPMLAHPHLLTILTREIKKLHQKSAVRVDKGRVNVAIENGTALSSPDYHSSSKLFEYTCSSYGHLTIYFAFCFIFNAPHIHILSARHPCHLQEETGQYSSGNL